MIERMDHKLKHDVNVEVKIALKDLIYALSKRCDKFDETVAQLALNRELDTESFAEKVIENIAHEISSGFFEEAFDQVRYEYIDEALDHQSYYEAGLVSSPPRYL